MMVYESHEPDAHDTTCRVSDCSDRTKRVLKPKAWKSRFDADEGDDDD
jgi:hypothetical protein